MLDIESLRFIWWLLMGIVLIAFAITDGFDFGCAMLMPLISRDDTDRRIILNTIGPFWEGNQVWIILGAGAIFAAWPFVYAVAFSGFYLLILLLLLTMGIARPVSFKYRSKLTNKLWRQCWDTIIVIGGFGPAIIFGILMGNIITGVPFYFDDDLRIFYTGSFSGLFHPFALICALTSVAMLMMHGGLYLAIKTENPLRQRAFFWVRIAAIMVIASFALGGIFIATKILGYQVLSGSDPFGYSNPLHKQVMQGQGFWLHNYFRYPLTMMAPGLGFIGALLVLLTANKGNSRFAFICSGFCIAGIIATVGVSLFPFILPSSMHYASSLLVWDASSSELTLLMMLIATIIFLPIIIMYTSWVYHALRGKVKREAVLDTKNNSVY